MESYSHPQISVNMITHNDWRYLPESIESVLKQSFEDFELIVVDDGSDERTRKILTIYADNDPRITLLRNERKMGRPYSRNKAWDNSKGTFIAILDADDVMLPDRLQIQHDFMDSRMDVMVCGSRFMAYETGDVFPRVLGNAAIRVQMLFDSPIANPTAMLRKNPVKRLTGGYDESFLAAQDYDLWERLTRNPKVVFANLPDILVRYRTHPEKDRTPYKDTQRHFADLVRQHQVEWLGLNPTKNDLRCHNMVSGFAPPEGPSIPLLEQSLDWVARLLRANRVTHRYDHEVLRQRLESVRDTFCQMLRQVRGGVLTAAQAPASLPRAGGADGAGAADSRRR